MILNADNHPARLGACCILNRVYGGKKKIDYERKCNFVTPHLSKCPEHKIWNRVRGSFGKGCGGFDRW